MVLTIFRENRQRSCIFSCLVVIEGLYHYIGVFSVLLMLCFTTK